MCVLSPAKGREGLYLSKHGGSDRPAVAHGNPSLGQSNRFQFRQLSRYDAVS